MPYSLSSDLLIGDIPLPSYISSDAYVQAAADEIDAVVGQIYVTPVVVQTSAINRVTTLILKKLNNFLASGRIILALDAAGQNDRLHAYGMYLIKESQGILVAISDGKILLPGAQLVVTNTGGTAPTILNAEKASLVDAFYENFNPAIPPWVQGRIWISEPEVVPGVE